MLLIRGLSWCRTRVLHNLLAHGMCGQRPCRGLCRLHTTGTSGNISWTSKEIREAFLRFFVERDHLYVHSSTVVPHKDEGTYFINAGMNQFKPILLGMVEPDTEMSRYTRVTNSQKCIRVGGKHNDLEDVGKDTHHHTFFEMLGSWSFGDYFKEEACKMSWQLLTEVYGLPTDRLYVTYFGGNDVLNLEPDIESRDIWCEIGVPPSRVLPFGMTDNFWDMGLTGPCGPCTEIHYDRTGQPGASRLVNSRDPSVIELWNLVFMQFDRQADGSLKKLPQRHVDTGMGLERLTAVLQGKLSNYDTDLFAPLFQAMHQCNRCPPYQGKLGAEDAEGRDAAYRIVADHIRMATVAIADGLRPGRRDLDSKLRLIIHRCIRQASTVLGAPPGVIGSLVPIVIHSLGEAFPELNENPEMIRSIIDQSEERYLKNVEQGHKVLQRALTKYGDITTLSGEQVLEIQDGRFGTSVPADLVCDLAEERGVNVDLDDFERVFKSKERTGAVSVEMGEELPGNKLNQHDVQLLRDLGVMATDDSLKYSYNYESSRDDQRYSFPSAEGSTVLALLRDGKLVSEVSSGDRCGVVLSQTNMYSESGGQAADRGTLQGQDAEVRVTDVQRSQGYVLHSGTVTNGQLRTGDKLAVCLDQEHREKCMCNHTATHILNFALDSTLGDVRQQGSKVTEDKLVFDFTCAKMSMTEADVVAVAGICRDMVEDRVHVHRGELALQDALQINGILTVQNMVYPQTVRVVALGLPVEQLKSDPHGGLGRSHSVELCGGTHVENTGDLQQLAIVSLQGLTQGTKRITAVTGTLASQARLNARQLQDQLLQLTEWTQQGLHRDRWADTARHIETSLSGSLLLPRVERDLITSSLEKLKAQVVSQQKNLQKKASLKENLHSLLDEQTDSPVCIAQLDFEASRDVIKVLVTEQPDSPIVAVSKPIFDKKAKKTTPNSHQRLLVLYLPKNTSLLEMTAEQWAVNIGNSVRGAATYPPKGKHGKHSNMHIVSLPVQSAADLECALDAARTVIRKCGR